MSDESLRADLERLRIEVNQAAGRDPDTQRKLNELINDIERRINDPSDEDDEGLIENIRAEIANFEAEHPRTTAILNDIMVTLSNMGI